MPTMKAHVDRTRTFTGCRTCRQRHAKCDEGRPVCGVCQRLGIECKGYDASLVWVTAVGDKTDDGEQRQSHRGSSYRRTLYVESARQRMTLELVESLEAQTVADALAHLESRCESWEDNLAAAPPLRQGPFGVFNGLNAEVDESDGRQITPLGQSASSPAKDCAGDSSESIPTVRKESHPPVPFRNLCQLSTVNAWHCQLELRGSNSSLGQTPTHDQGLSSEEVVNDQHQVASASDGDGINISWNPAYAGGTTTTDEYSISIMRSMMAHRAAGISPLLPSLLQNNENCRMPAYAETLLNYYSDHVVKSPTGIQSRKQSPWTSLFLPCALQTFAEIYVTNTATDARLAIFYAIIANSAFKLHGAKLNEGSWYEVATGHQKKAKLHLLRALHEELSGKSKVKYKELLMAVLSVAMISLFNEAQTFKGYLMDAEYLIRTRGLRKRKSHKARILHHMYTHLRILAEATCTPYHCASKFKGFIQPPSSSASERGFATREESLDSGLDPACEKTDESGYNDIHLESQGLWKETLYPEIYGIPESLMTLLSQVISLANAQVKLNPADDADAQFAMAMAQRIDALESSILSWEIDSDFTSDQGEKLPVTNHIRQCMVLAIHHTLIIYFFRRVRNANYRSLQCNVTQVLDYIQPCIENGLGDQDFATSIAWCAYVATCGAETSLLKERGIACLANIHKSGIIISSEPTIHVKYYWGLREIKEI